MLYQLSNGKVVSLTIEEYLTLTDEDIQALVALNVGKIPTSNWHGSVIKKPRITEDNETSDSIEFLSLEELDERDNQFNKIDINNIPDEDDSEFLEMFTD
jgi:hypothetical protein